eukprot:3053839-Pyramimonas_sp.AAC.1
MRQSLRPNSPVSPPADGACAKAPRPAGHGAGAPTRCARKCEEQWNLLPVITGFRRNALLPSQPFGALISGKHVAETFHFSGGKATSKNWLKATCAFVEIIQDCGHVADHVEAIHSWGQVR